MALQTTTNINVDFYDKKYIMINAKQYDDCSRWITITCYDNGKLFNLSSSKHTAYIRYRKADYNGVLNSCRINTKGEVLVELTEQMLSADGICYVDLIIVNKGSAIINIDTGELVTIDGSPIISTMAFCVNVYEAAFDSSVVESSDEYIALSDALKMANAEYKEVIQLAKSYAIGDAGDIRENEDFDNSKYYSKLSESYTHGGTGIVARNTNGINENTDNAKYYNEMAESYAKGYTKNDIRDGEDTDNAKHYYELARSYTVGDNKKRNNEETDNAYYYYQMSESYAKGDTESDIRSGEDTDNAEYYSRLSKSYAKGGTNIAERNLEDTDNAEYYSRLSKSYAVGSLGGSTGTRSDESTENAKTYMETAISSAITSQRFAVGGTNTVDGEDTDNSKYYYKLTRSYTKGDINLRADEDIDNAEYYYKLARSYTKGNIGLRAGEDTDNTEYYYGQCVSYARDASVSKTETEAAQRAAEAARNDAENSKLASATSEANAKISETNASVSETNAKISEQAAAASEAKALTSEANASASAANALGYTDITKSYAVGGTGMRENEDFDNAKYYYELTSSIANNLDRNNIAIVDEVKEYLGI